MRHRLLLRSAITTLAMLGLGGVALGVCVSNTAYVVTSSAPPPIGFWTDTSGAVWSPAGGFPGCASGDSAADTNGTPTTLIINSAIPNQLSGLTVTCPGCTMDVQSGGSMTLAGTGSLSSSSTIIVEPGGTFTVASGGAMTFNSGTSLSVNGGYADVQSGGQLNILGASTVTNNGTLNVSGGMAVNNLFTVQSTGHVTLDGATVTGTNRINNLGTLTSTGNTTYGAWITGTPAVQVDSGTLTVSGTIDSPIDVNAGATLGGTGSITGAVNVIGGTVSPGTSPGTLHTADLTLDASSAFDVELNGTTAGTQYDQADVTGAITLGGAALHITLGYTPAAGDAFTILNNDGSDGVTGTFAGMPQGATFCAAGAEFQISYSGGTGNDVVLTVVGAPGVATHFDVSAPANATAGTPFNVAVTARDACGNIATGFAGLVQFTSTDGQAVLVSNVPLTNGVGSFPTTLKTAGPQTITATSGITGTSNDISVAAGTATHFEVTAPANVTAGTSFNFTVTALDAYDNTVTNFAGSVHFTSSDSAATLPADSTLINGTGTFPATLAMSGTQTITATSGITGTSGDISVAAGTATHFEVTAPANVTAGTPFNFTVTAVDAYDNTVTDFAGSVHFTSSDSAATLPTDSTLTNGTGTFPATLAMSGTQTITATSGITGTSGDISVGAGTATHFEVTAPANVTAGTSFNFTVTALDAYDNTVTDFSGSVHFTSSDSAATLPTDSTLTNGTGTFPATLAMSGTQTITATSGITGTSGDISVAAGTATHFEVTAPANVTAGTPFNFMVTALDAYDNTVTDFAGSVHFTSSDSAATLPADSTLTNGVGTFPATLSTFGTQTMTATSGITGTSNDISVAAGTATHFEVTAPANATAGIPFNFTVTALDAYDNTATGFAGTVHFTSSDSSATLPADTTLTDGVGTFSATLHTTGTITATSGAVTGTSNAISSATASVPALSSLALALLAAILTLSAIVKLR